jgi:hypothetical protein
MKLTKKDIKLTITSLEGIIESLKAESNEFPHMASHNEIRIYKSEGKIELLKSFL